MNNLRRFEKTILSDSKEKETQSANKSRIKVCKLKADGPVSNLEILVLRRYPPRIVSNRKCTGRVAAACDLDEPGVVGLVLWNEQIDQVATGDIVQIRNGWFKQRLGERVVSTGRNGKLELIG